MEIIQKLLQEGKAKHEIKKVLQDQFNWGKTKAYKEINKVISGTIKTQVEKPLEFNEKFVFNKDTDKYIFLNSKQVKSGNLLLPGQTVRLIQKDYSTLGGKSLTINELSIKYKLSVGVINELVHALNISHTCLPFTDETIKEKSTEELKKEFQQNQKLELFQELQKQEWSDVQEAANKWRQFQCEVYDPFENFFKNWTPPTYKYVQTKPLTTPVKAGRHFVVTCMDWHISSRAEERYLFSGKEWNTETAKKAVESYANQIGNSVTGEKYENAVILLGGDLFHSITGFTEKGVPLNNEYSRDTQFDAVSDCLVLFIDRMLKIFGKLQIAFIRGNHGGTTDYTLGKMLKAYYRTEKNIDFTVYSSRVAMFKIGGVLVALDHGASDRFKSMLPTNAKALEAHIQHIFLSKPELLTGVKQKLFICGDLHNFSQKEYADFEFIRTGALPCGDEYADAKNLHSRARQNCIVVGDNGIECVKHFYLD